MRLTTFTVLGATRIGRVEGAKGDEVIVELPASDLRFTNMIALLTAGPDALRAASAVSGPVWPLRSVHLLAPVPRPSKILAIGLNYHNHVKESGREPPEHQIWFNKQTTAASGPFDQIELPEQSAFVDYEAELVAVIGRRCRHVPAERAHEVIAGYCLGNDVSVRDWQMRSPTMTMGKSWDTHAPFGPWITTPDEIGDWRDIELRLSLNGGLRQQDRAGGMIFPIEAQIAHLSTAFTLEPGDVIFTGTPAGVGAARDPREFLKAGDRVRVEAEPLGAIENVCVAVESKCVMGEVG